MCDRLKDLGKILTGGVNSLFEGKQPWQIVAITTSSVIYGFWVYDLLRQDDTVYNRMKKKIFKLSRRIPFVREKIKTSLAEQKAGFERSMIKSVNGMPYISTLPNDGLADLEIMKKVDEYLSLGHFKWREGKVSGAVYYYDPELVEFVQAVYGKASYTNPLHPDIFPGVCKMEAEVIRMTASLFHGTEDACGTMTTGGTESLMMSVKAYRDYGREEKGITRPNLVMPVTAHTGLDKAAQYLGVYVRTVKLEPETAKVDLAAMEKAINKNTIMLVGSAPNFPYGTMDDIEGIAKLGLKYNIPVHVDACLGGFVIAFMKRAGYPLPQFDFRVAGVTSISADTHKYGFSPKGSSVILYSDPKYRHYQFTVTTDWPGGVYGSPTVNGSRAGGVIAATWATMLRFGEDGYTEATKAIVDTTKYIEIGLRKLDNIYIFGTPATSVIAIGSKVFDIYRLSSGLSDLGWNLNNLQFPSGIHICVTFMHTKAGVADQFLADVKSQLEVIMKNPEKPVEGQMAVYGLAQSLPDRTLVGDITRLYLDAMYYTPPKTQ